MKRALPIITALLLDTDQDAKTGHLGYDYRVNDTRSASDSASIERWSGKAWEPTDTAKLQVGTNELHLALERGVLGFAPDKPVSFDFKWTDNVPANADGMDFFDQGDSAPNARFSYRYVAIQQQPHKPEALPPFALPIK